MRICITPNTRGLDIIVSLSQSRKQSLELRPSLMLTTLMILAHNVLLPTLRHQRLACLTIDTLQLTQEDVVDQAFHQELLRDLRHTFRDVRIGWMCLGVPEGPQYSAAQAEAAWRVMQLLGQPQALELRLGLPVTRGGRLHIKLGGLRHAGQQQQREATAKAQGTAGAQVQRTAAADGGSWWNPCRPLIGSTASAAVEAALQRLADAVMGTGSRSGVDGSGGSGADGGVGGYGSGASGDKGSGDGIDGGEDGTSGAEVLLLRGPFALSMCETGAVGPWLLSLELHTANGAANNAGSSSSADCSGRRDVHTFRRVAANAREADHRRCVYEYQLVPASGSATGGL